MRKQRATASELFMALSDKMHEKDVAEHGPNPPNVSRDLSKTTLTGNEILLVYHAIDPHEAGNDDDEDEEQSAVWDGVERRVRP